MIATLAALGEPTRFQIVELLGTSPRSVGEICDALSLGQPQASKHLRVLRNAGVVDVEVRAQSRIYALRAAPLRELNAWLERYRSIWDERMNQLDELIEELKENEDGRRRRR